VLGIFFFFFFFRDAILESVKNVLPPVKPDILKSSASYSKCLKSLQHQLIGAVHVAKPCRFSRTGHGHRNTDHVKGKDTDGTDMDKKMNMDTYMSIDMANFY
jgi:hypothetical protein